MKKCLICNKEYDIITRNECKICSYKKRNKENYDKLLENNKWSIKEIDIILENILYKKIDVVNEIIPLLTDKTLNDLVYLLRHEMKIGGQTPQKVNIKCSNCGKYFIKTLAFYENERKYCSFDCRNKGKIKFGVHKGSNNSRYNSKIIKCTNCEKDILVSKYKREKVNTYGEINNFCSQKCYWEYRSKHYVKELNVNYKTKFSKERCKRMSIITSKRISDGKFKQTQTKPHIKTNNILKRMSIKYTNEYNMKYHSLDIYLDDFNLGIEVMGDYWHGNPIKYKNYDLLSKIQLKSIKQDKSKHTYSKKYHNFEILYLWEKDINMNETICIELIQKYIEMNGILKEYNSFNYELIDEKLKLKKEIIKPYF